MWAAVNIFTLTQLYTHRYLKHMWKCGLYLHIIMGIFMLLIALLGLIYMMFYLGYKSDLTKTGWAWPLADNSIHAWLGYSVLLLMFYAAITGLIACRKRQNRVEEWNTVEIIRRKKIHRYLAYVVIITG